CLTYLFLTAVTTFTILFFFFKCASTPAFSTLSLHDALPICRLPLVGPDERDAAGTQRLGVCPRRWMRPHAGVHRRRDEDRDAARSEEHTSELQSRGHLVCRLLLEKKKKTSILLLR